MSGFGPLIVHNCVLGLGYGMGPSKFIDTAKTYALNFDAEAAEKIVRDWRNANPHIVKLWWAADRKIRECIEAAAASPTKQAAREINQWLSVDVRPAKNGSPLLTMMLPSGRRLYYRDIALEAEDAAQIEYERREIKQAFLADEIEGHEALRMLAELDQREPGKLSITYSGVHQLTKRWTKIRSYGAKIIENCCQSVARDVVCDMAIKIDAAKLGDLVLSVHDELIYEIPEDEANARFRAIEKIMNTTPGWAPGLPVAAEGAIMDRYGK